MTEYRKLASIQTISALEPIDGADRIELAKVSGWQSVVRKGDFAVGDTVIFAEIDSILPKADWSSFLSDKNNPDKPIRIKTCRLKGQLSQGVIFPTSILSNLPTEVGSDVTELLGITKYEAPIPANLNGKVKGNFPSHLVPKTDELRIQSYPAVLDELRDVNVYITVKYDGTSFTCYHANGNFGVCSRNLELDEDGDSTYWKIAKEMDLQNKLKSVPFNVAIQAELYGEGIQGNKLGITGQKLAVFNVYNIDEQRYLGFIEMMQLLNTHKLGTVAELAFIGKFPFNDTESVLKFADEVKYANGTPAEGVVIRPLDARSSAVLRGRLSIKAISNAFLEKYGE